MKLEPHTLLNFGGKTGVFRIAVNPMGSFIRQLRQIVGLELDTIELVIAAKLLDFLLTFLR